MKDKLITLAIHTTGKAHILQQTLSRKGIKSTLVDLSNTQGNGSDAIAVRIDQVDLPRALAVIEGERLFRYDDKEIYKIDDGRKRILVAVDFSDYSIKACRAAFAIAYRMNAKVKILHVYKMRYPITFPFADQIDTGPNTDMLDIARKQMIDFCYEIEKKISEKEFPSVNYSYSLREGSVEDEINSFVEEYKPFMLVVGRKGITNSQQHLVGNVTADIIEMTSVPVMVIPENSPIKTAEDVKHIAYLTNLQKSDLDSFDNLVNILSPYPNLIITLLHINASDKKEDKWTETELRGMKVYFNDKYPSLNIKYEIIDSPDMLHAVEDYVKEKDVDILTMSSRRRGLFGRIFNPSITRKVLSDSDVALIVFRE
ncbi:universal stress protein [Dysgonomonas sp. Marseille-P4677]|uniref:universal stress protein n=1 Tax=Dysgonomonas sp. Marseille-P4677 TaxID=2364790 RepID=UPI0019140A85|nr:universal stress protein [Dysgonomonas sp. Marseille-P4677]MBK5721263.1 universal stress protein [Dysgonomonas sp. Marseille-P4677]